MGENLYIYPLNVKALKSLIGNDQLGKVIVLLNKWVGNNGSSYENEIINFSRRSRELKKLARSGHASPEVISGLKSKICLDLLSLLDDIHEEDQENDFFGLEGNI